MKRFLKYALIAASLFALNVQAESRSQTFAAASETNWVSKPMLLTSIYINNTSTNANLVKLFDAPATNVTYALTAYITSVATYSNAVVQTYTNFAGVTETFTNAGTWTVSTTNSAVTNSFRTLYVVTVPASTAVTITPVGGLYGSYGLLSTNGYACEMTLVYNPIR